MKKSLSLLLAIFIFGLSQSVNAQKIAKPIYKGNGNPQHIVPGALKRPAKFKKKNTTAKIRTQKADFSHPLTYKPLPPIERVHIVSKDEDGLPVFVKGEITGKENKAPVIDQCYQYLEVLKTKMKIENPDEEFEIIKNSIDEQGEQHIKMQQMYKGLPVFASEVVLHAKNSKVHLFNGRYHPTPKLTNLSPSVTEEAAIAAAFADLHHYLEGNFTGNVESDLVNYEETVPELMVYYQAKTPELIWHFYIHPGISERWEYFVDAQTGEVLHRINTVCKISANGHAHHGTAITTTAIPHQSVATANRFDPLDGPTTANATDLKGITRTIHVYQVSSGANAGYYMLDASRSMSNPGASNYPDDPKGAIWTIDAQNQVPASDGSMNLAHVYSSNNNSWNPTGVSAHYNAGVAYEYYKNKFSRNSINGSGGSIVSIINVTQDGNGMDNAFWNGQAMFYGNGDVAFTPLAKSLDVAGHELTHGVIQNTANLVYENQSGAMNESFADVFGVLIENETNDYQLGEDVVNTSYFPTGFLRDMANPHNGTTQGHNGWQPANMSEYVNLPNTPQGDHGGVHVNSGIPNHAFYLIATGIGRNKAEQIYYKALRDYLTKSSQFVDLRNAVVQAAQSLYGQTEVDACKNAFNAVGIGEGAGTDNQTDYEANDGTQYVLMTGGNLQQIYLFNFNDDPFPIDGHTLLSRPSVSDDGKFIVFVANDNTLRALQLNESNLYESYQLSDDPVFRNAAVSKDGNKIAALTTDQDNQILVYDFNHEEIGWSYFELYNPTTAEGVVTGDVDFADILEWDFSGEYIMYDAQNTLSDDFGSSTQYWDIGFVRVWNNELDIPGDGTVFKLYNGLPDDVSVGNPTFSKNSDYIIAFDYIQNTDSGTDFHLRTANIETNTTGEIFNNTDLNYPNFSVSDDRIIFDFLNGGTDQIIAQVTIAADKMSPTGEATIFMNGEKKWGVWYALGERDLTDVEALPTADGLIDVFPNPTSGLINISFEKELHCRSLTVTDVAGKTVLTKPQFDESSLDLSQLGKGVYLIRFDTDQGVVNKKVVME